MSDEKYEVEVEQVAYDDDKPDEKDSVYTIVQSASPICAICECWEEVDSRLICRLLNEHEYRSNPTTYAFLRAQLEMTEEETGGGYIRQFEFIARSFEAGDYAPDLPEKYWDGGCLNGFKLILGHLKGYDARECDKIALEKYIEIATHINKKIR